MKNTKARPMRLVTAWAWIEESDINPVIPAPSSDTKGKHRLNSLNTGDDSNSNSNSNSKHRACKVHMRSFNDKEIFSSIYTMRPHTRLSSIYTMRPHTL